MSAFVRKGSGSVRVMSGMTSEFRLQRYYLTQTTPPYKIWEIGEVKIIFRCKQSLLSLNVMQSYITNLIPAKFFRPNRAFDCAHIAYDVNDRAIKRALDSLAWQSKICL